MTSTRSLGAIRSDTWPGAGPRPPESQTQLSLARQLLTLSLAADRHLSIMDVRRWSGVSSNREALERWRSILTSCEQRERNLRRD